MSLNFSFVSANPLCEGYYDFRGKWVPGLITYGSWRLSTPVHTIGEALRYNPGVMEDALRDFGIDPQNSQFVDGVALQSPSDLGKTVWLRRPGYNWEGPFISVDYAAREHMFSHIYYSYEVIEIGFKTAEMWRNAALDEEGNPVTLISSQTVEVFIGQVPPSGGEPINYRDWWLDQVWFEYEGADLDLDEAWVENPEPK